MANDLWTKLCTTDALRKVWHLTRADLSQDFIEHPFAKEAFGYYLDPTLDSLLRVLNLGDFQVSPITRVAIPKGALATRPGTLISVADRVVLFAALRWIAEPIDKHLPENVYSYRLKSERRLLVS
jgi:hypothetical protein